MWSTSRWPRSATISARRASSSRPKASACSQVSVVAAELMIVLSSQVQLEIRERRGDAQLDLLVALARDRARHEVAHGARALGARAGAADAHAAAVLRPLAGALERFQQRAAVGDGAMPTRARQPDGERARLGAARPRQRRQRRGHEAL